jgi:CheY-like chemotaxis protein
LEREKGDSAMELARLRILIAEDEKNIGDLLVELLSRDDREITIVHDGLDAVRRLKKGSYDLLITDLMMPELDGMEVLHQAKRLYPQILVIIITGYASLETAIQAVKEGAYDYLRKPFRLDELKISVDNACEKIHLMRENRLLLKNLKKAQWEKKPEKDAKKPEDDSLPVLGPDYFGPGWMPPAYFQTDVVSPSAALTEIERLGSLRQQGLITDEEFQTLKNRVIGRIR